MDVGTFNGAQKGHFFEDVKLLFNILMCKLMRVFFLKLKKGNKNYKEECKLKQDKSLLRKAHKRYPNYRNSIIFIHAHQRPHSPIRR